METFGPTEFNDLRGPWSPGAGQGGLLAVSGQLPVDHRSGRVIGNDISGQVDQCMANVESILRAGEASLASVIKVTVYLLAYNDFPQMNAAYARFFADGKYPARSCVTVSDLPVIGGVQVRCIIDAIAVPMAPIGLNVPS